MNGLKESEKSPPLTIIRRAQMASVFIGALAAPSIVLFGGIFETSKAIFTPLSMLGLLICAPAYLILRMFGCEKLLSSAPGTGVARTFLILAGVNGVLFFVFGTVVGWIVQRSISKHKAGP